VELERAHTAGEEQAAEDQADAETDAALQPGGDAAAVDAFGGAEQVAAVDPGGGHRERGQPQRHGAARDHEAGRGAGAVAAGGEPADGEKRGVDQDDRQHAGARAGGLILRCFT
jgi:hypothetical protein